MSMRDSNNRLTICEVLRQINDRLQREDCSIERDMLALAEQMAKRMAAKLREQNEQFDTDWWKENVRYKETLIQRENEKYCTGDADRALAHLSDSGAVRGAVRVAAVVDGALDWV